MDGVFKNLHVLDFSWVAAGPIHTKYLADFGATVVRIESADRPDMLRQSAPFKDEKPGLNRSGYYAIYNTNKLSLSLDLKNPKDPVHEFLRTNNVQVLKPQMATGSKVYYKDLDGAVR